MEVLLSKRADEFVPKNRWIASLSNGETIFEDNRPGLPAAWERLAKYVKKHDLSITCLRVQIGGLEYKCPPGQEGYIQKKKVWSTGASGGSMLCVGYVDRGRARIDHLSSDRGSHTIYTEDPGEPWVIYSKEKRDAIAQSK